MEYQRALGIDIGTNYTTVSIFNEGRIQTLSDFTNPTDAYSQKVPTCISYTTRGVLIGNAARMNYNSSPQSTMFFFKKYIGKDFVTCKAVNEELRSSLKIVSDCFGNPIIQMQVGEEIVEKTPSEVYTDFIRALVEIIEERLNRTFLFLVLTVPADYEQNRIYAIMSAAGRIRPTIMEKITVLPTISEPIAAALSLRNRDTLDTRYIMVYDFGGGTFDVAIIEVMMSNYRVISLAGHSHLGGLDLDCQVMQGILNYLKSCNIECNDPLKLHRLRLQCESAKIVLSSETQAYIDLTEFGIESSFTITRETLNKMIKPYIDLTIGYCRKAMQQINLEFTSKDSIVLIGGSSRIPYIRERLQREFNIAIRDENNNVLNPDCAVSQGAVLHGIHKIHEMYPNIPYPFSDPPVFHLVFVHDIGYSIGRSNQKVTMLFKNGETVKHEKMIEIEGRLWKQNLSLYEFSSVENKWVKLGDVNIPTGPRMRVTFKMDVKGLLNYSYTYLGKQYTGSITFQNTYTSNEIKIMQERRVEATKWISWLNDFRKYYNNHPNQEKFSTMVDNLIRDYLQTDMVCYSTSEDIRNSVKDVYERICVELRR